VRVVLRNPRREIEVPGPKTVSALLAELELNPESVLVIAGDELVPKDARLPDGATVEIRPVMSGGASDREAGTPPRSERPNRGGAGGLS
jgi:sulfur carrier protein